MRVAVYLRKSRAEEFHDPVEQTLERHRKMLLEYAEEHSLAVDETDIYEEVVSGERLCERPKMSELLAEVEKGKYDGVLCMDIDRLGRGAMSEQGIILETFKRSSTRIITPRKTYDLANELDEEYSEFETFMARRELKLIKRRMRRGVERTVREGGFLAVPPFGYSADTSGKRPTLKINENEACYVRMMFDLYVNYGKGCQYIADKLNLLGVKPHRSEKFCRTSVRHILKNPVFTGKVVWNRKQTVSAGGISQSRKKTVTRPRDEWTVVDGLHPPIIDENTFFKAQEIFEKRYHPPAYDGTIQNPLAGILRCGKCGALIQRKPLTNKNGAILFCPTKGCVASAKLDTVENGISELLRPDMEKISMERFIQPNDKKRTPSLADELEICRKNLSKKCETLYDLLESGVYSAETFLRRKYELEQKISELELTGSEFKQNNYRDTYLSDIKSQSVYTYYLSAPASVKNRILKAFVKEGIYYKQKGWGAERFVVELLLKDNGYLNYGENEQSLSPHES